MCVIYVARAVEIRSCYSSTDGLKQTADPLLQQRRRNDFPPLGSILADHKERTCGTWETADGTGSGDAERRLNQRKGFLEVTF